MSPGHLRRASVSAPGIATVALVACLACAPAAHVPPASAAGAPTSAVDGLRIVGSRTARDVSPDAMLARLATADVVIFGEQHDDPQTHRAEAWVLEALGRSGRAVVLSLEMFERDVQRALDDYLAGRVSEEEFLARSRPWPNYATDYRPLVELARERGWRVVAANVPRPMASAVGRRGFPALDPLAPGARAHGAFDIRCPDDDYRRRFLEQMRSHAPPGAAAAADTLPTATAERFYLAQCLKDETMAESVVAALREAPRGAVVLHVTGSFHAEFGHGVVDRVRRRAPDADVAVLVAVPTPDPAQAAVASHPGRADFLLFTRTAAPRQ